MEKTTIINSKGGIIAWVLIDDREKQEIEYLLKREMDEILFDLKDARIEYIVKRAMDERYAILFSCSEGSQVIRSV